MKAIRAISGFYYVHRGPALWSKEILLPPQLQYVMYYLLF